MLSIVSGLAEEEVAVVGVPLQSDPRRIKWPEATLWNAAYAGDVPTVKRLLRERPQLIDEVGYLKTLRSAVDGGGAVRLGLRRFNPGGSPCHAVLPAPPGDESRATALQYALIGGRCEAAKALLKKGADPDARCQQGSTAAEVVSHPHRPQMAAMLARAADRRQRPAGGLLHRIARLFD